MKQIGYKQVKVCGITILEKTLYIYETSCLYCIKYKLLGFKVFEVHIGHAALQMKNVKDML